MPTCENQNQNNSFYDSETIADGFVLFLKKNVNSYDQNLFSNSALGKTSDMIEVKNDPEDKFEVKESVLPKILKDHLEDEPEDDMDIEEKLTDEWHKDVKNFSSTLPIRNASITRRSGFKIRLKSPVKLLLPPNWSYYLPANHYLKKYDNNRALHKIEATPWQVKLATLLFIALISSVFISYFKPNLSNRITGTTDNILAFPLASVNQIAEYMNPYKITDNSFYKKVDQIIAGNVKIKANYIIKNQNKLETQENASDSFVITRQDILGLPASASDGNVDAPNNKTWKVKSDIILEKISSSVLGVVDYLVAKQEELSAKSINK